MVKRTLLVVILALHFFALSTPTTAHAPWPDCFPCVVG
jgi:hypothetical protein